MEELYDLWYNYFMKRRAFLMNNSTKATVENMTISAELASTIAELKASISSLNALVESLKSDNEYLKNNNDLLREENAYLKRKLFGVKSEKMWYYVKKKYQSN